MARSVPQLVAALATWVRSRRRLGPGAARRTAILCALVLVVGVTYARTLLPGLHEFGDVTKAQFLGRLLGMTHPTGYPLYILLTAPISRLPLGTLALRINACSALMGLGAVLLAYLLLRRLRVRPSVACVSALAFAWSRTTWEQFVIAEVYALGACLVALVLFLLVRWMGTGQRAWFLAAAGVYALSFGNHLTVVTLLPAFALATFLGPFRRLPLLSTTGWVVLFVLLGMAQYAYLFWASASDSPYLEYRVHDFAEFVDYVSGARYRRSMFAFGVGEIVEERLPRFARLVFRDLGWICLLAPIGLSSALIPPRRSDAHHSLLVRSSLVLLVGGVGQLGWLLVYDIPDIDVYAIPLLLIVTLFSGLGLEALTRWVLAWVARRARRADAEAPPAGPTRGWAQAALALLLALLSAALVLPSVFRNAPSHAKAERFTRHMDEDLATLGTGAIIVGAIHYGPRMALVERLYAEGSSDARNLHLAATATPAQVKKYLQGKRSLRDSYTRTSLPPGLRVFLHERGASTNYGSDVRKVRRGRLRELLVKGRSRASTLR